MKYALFIATLTLLLTNDTFAQPYRLLSPDRHISVAVNTTGKISYSLSLNDKNIIVDAPLGFEFANEPPMGSNMEVINQERRTDQEEWRPVVPYKHSLIKNACNELRLTLKETGGMRRRLDIFFRAYNDGIAFRYQLYGSAFIGDRKITKELSGFRFAGNPKVWVADYGKYTSSQESEFQPRLLSDIRQKTVAGLPFLVEIDSTAYAAITEAAIDNYPGFYIGAASDTGAAVLTTKLSPLPGENEQGVKARFSDRLLTPWRVIMLAGSPGKLIESDIIQNLNPPCAIKDAAWIRPGISAWDHWWSGDVKMDMPTIRQYIDLAAVQRWPYMLVDWQWYGPFNKPEADITKAAPQLDLPALLRYAKEKHVRLWLWLYSTDVNRNNNFEKAFALYEKWGIAGVKIDFMDRDDQEMVNWYRRIVTTAARHHLMVDFHGAYKPDGISRTYPNLITREGVMGEEYAKFSDRITPAHNVTLPFTRMLAGPMDYTPGGFLNVTKDQFHQGVPAEIMNTRCAELAKFVIYESPFMVYCDAPQHILGQPGADFLRIVPSVWDDVRVLDGYPGEYIVIARRKGDRWFIAAMTNGRKRTVHYRLGFLAKGKYELESWSDASDADTHPQHLQKARQPVDRNTLLTIDMASGGGYVGCIACGN